MSALDIEMSRPGWLKSFGLMLLWEGLSMRLVLPLAMIVQVFIGAGMAVGIGFFIGDVPEQMALYLASGVAVVTMITLGLVLAPQLIAQQKATGIYDFMFSLPVPRTASIAAGIVINGLIATPGVALALLVAVWRYDLDLVVRPLFLPAALLTVITAAAIGHAMAHAISNVMVINLLTQILVFVILLFSPIQYPADRLPAWLATLHQGLPFVHAANVVRAGLTTLPAEHLGRSFLVLGLWAVVSWAVTLWVVGRRG